MIVVEIGDVKMNNKKLTMSDIANMAGVSKSTVSRYFNGGYVKEETRTILKKVIEDHQYEPNAIAQSLKAKHSKTIGIVAPCLDSTTSSRVLMSIDEYLKNKGYTTIIINTNHNELRELTSIEQLWRMNVEGIILLATHVTMAHQKIASKIDIPLIFVAQEFKEGISILHDDYKAGFTIGNYVSLKGHKHIGYVGVSQKDQAVGVDRKKGVINGLKQNGVNTVDIIETDFTFQKTRQIIKDYLHRRQPTVLICATDTIALACYKEILALGLRVPEDISLSGFGGYEISMLLTPELCTIRYDSEKVGIVTGETILKLIQREEVKKKQLIGYTFIEGKSIKNIT